MKINMNHFSDLHYNSVTSFDEMERLLDKLLEANPDYLMFTGDLLDSNDEQYIAVAANYLGIHYFFNSDYDKAMKYALHMMDYDLTYGSGDQIFSACAKGKPKTAARMRAEHRPL